MESERTYSSTEVNVRKFSAGVSDGTMNSEVFDGFVNAGAQDEGNEQEDSVKDKENTKPIDINEKMEALKSKISNVRAHRLSGEEDLRDSIKRLKQECLDLLIRLLFPEVVDGSPKTKCEDALKTCKDQCLLCFIIRIKGFIILKRMRVLPLAQRD